MRTIIIFTIIALLIFSGCQTKPQEFVQSENIMGTVVTIKVVDSNAARVNKSLHAAFETMKKIEAKLSHKLEDSEVVQLNNNGVKKDISDDFEKVLTKALFYGQVSNGAFDISVQPILDLYTKSFRELKQPPSDEEIKKTLLLIDYSKITLHEDKKVTLEPDMKITLGGIAKGHIIDAAFETVRSYGIKNVLVNAGGDIRAIGKNIRNEPWLIALQNPRDRGDFIAKLSLFNTAIATSGDYERYFEPEKKFHHIVNPQTGYSAIDLISVTIIAPQAIDADALATSVFVLGKEKGLKLIEEIEFAEGLIITANRTIHKSSGFSKYEQKTLS